MYSLTAMLTLQLVVLLHDQGQSKAIQVEAFHVFKVQYQVHLSFETLPLFSSVNLLSKIDMLFLLSVKLNIFLSVTSCLLPIRTSHLRSLAYLPLTKTSSLGSQQTSLQTKVNCSFIFTIKQDRLCKIIYRALQRISSSKLTKLRLSPRYRRCN